MLVQLLLLQALLDTLTANVDTTTFLLETTLILKKDINSLL